MDNLIRLYESTEKAFTSGGLGCLSDATKCIVAEERNGEYELELEYPINGIHYSDIAIRRIILCRPNPYDDPQPFRIYSISKPISGIVTVNAAHVCYDLSNYVCLPFIATTSAEVFQRLNGYASGSETSRIYPPGIIYNASTNPYGFRFTTDMNVSFPPKAQSQKPEPEDERFKVLIPKSIKAVLGDASDCILGRFINSQGHRGEYYYNRFHIYLKDPDGSSPRGATRGFEIRYGKNMTDVEKEENCKEDYTHILPFWKSVQSQDTTIAILGGDGQTAPVVAVPGSAGRTDIKIKIVDLSSEFDKSPTATKLTQYAQDYISENELTGQPSVNITVNFQSVANSSEYSAYSKLEEVRLCDKVKVIYEALGIVDEKKVIRYEYNVLKCAYDEIEIGDPKDELANTISGTSQVTMNTQSVGETVKNGLVETITNAIKLSQTIYYVDTTGTYTEANPPAPPEDWVIDTIQTKGKPNVWTATEPESTDKGNVFTYSQNRLTDDTVNLSDFSLANIATTVRNIVDPNDPTKVHGDNLTDESVDTPKITDEAITSTKLAADAVQSRTYTAGSDPYYSSEGTLINLAGEGFIRAKNFSIDANGNVHLRGTVTATAGYLGTEQNGFAIESNALTGTYVRSGDAYAVTLTTDGSLVMRPVPFDVGNSYRSSVLSDGILRLSAYNDNIGTAGRIDVDSANMGMTFYKYSATTAENLENYAINGQNGTAIGSIEVLNTNNTSIMSTTGTWQLSGDTYISGHTNQTIKEWIESIEAGGIAPATTSTLGGVIIGSGLSVAANGLLTVDTNYIATRSWVNSTFAKPSDIKTYTGTDPITISSGNAISINYSTGLTLGDGSALEVDLTTNSPIASKTWVGQQGYLTSIPTASSNVKGGVKVDATGGLSVTNEVLKVNLGTGLEFGNSTNIIQVIDYANLAKKSEIPTVNNATLTIQKNGTTVKTFTANASTNVTANIEVPTKTSDLTNDSGFLTSIPTAGTNTIGGVKIPASSVISNTNGALDVKYGTGLDVDDDNNLVIASTVALKSDIPTVNNATLTIQKNGTTVKTFTANASSNVTANITVPTKVSDLTNDSGFITSIPTAGTNVIGGVKIPASSVISNISGAIDVKYGTGLDVDDDNNLVIASTVALKSDIPTVNNATLTIQKNGSTVKTFTANASSNVTANITVPTKTSDLTNDSGFITGIAWSAVTSKPFNTVGDGLVVDTNKILKVKAGNGIKIDSDADNGVAVDLSASDIPTLTSAKISDFDSAVDTALGIGTGSTFLRKDGTWVTPTGTVYSAGDGITVSGTTISAKYGTGLTTDGNDALAVDTTTIALKSDIKTYTAGTGIAISSANAISNSGVRAVTINGNNLRVNTNGTNADLTIPYATSAGSAPASDVYAWAKAATKPTYTATEVGALPISGGRMSGNITWTNSSLPVFSDSPTYLLGIEAFASGGATKYARASNVTVGTASKITGNTIALGTAVTSTATNFTGASAITIPVTGVKEAYLSWGGKNFAASFGVIDAAMIPDFGANRFAFLKADGITVEYSTDAGSSWTDYGLTDGQKSGGIFAVGTNVYLGKHTSAGSGTINDQLRIIINTSLAQIYTQLNKFAIYITTRGATVLCKIESATHANPTVFSDILDWTEIRGDGGWNVLNVSAFTTYGNSNSHHQYIRIIFKVTTTPSANYPSPWITRIMAFGGMGWSTPSNMAKNGHLYSYDASQNATFPANVAATKFIGDLTGNASTASRLTPLASNDNASASDTWRKVWMCYIDGTTGRPAVSNALTFQTSSGTLKATNFSGKFAGYTLASACAKAVDTSISASSTSANLPTSAAVATFVEGKGYITSIPTATTQAIGGVKVPSGSGLSISNGSLGLNIGTGLDVDNNNNLIVSLSASNIPTITSSKISDFTSAAKTAIGIASSGSTFLRKDGTWASPTVSSIAWSSVTSKPFTSVNESGGLEVASNDLQVKAGTGLTINSDSGELEVSFGTTATTAAKGNHTHTITAAVTDGVWNLTGTNGANQVKYAVDPYPASTATSTWITTAANAGKFYLGTNRTPYGSTRLNYNGILYAKDVYVGTSGSTVDQRLTSLEEQICLIEGTKIKMADGSEKSIEDVQTGDMVLSYNPAKAEQIPAMALKSVRTGVAKDFDVLVYENGNYAEMYQEHSIYDTALGYPHSHKEWNVGDEGLMVDGPSKLIRKTTSRHAIIKERFVLVTSTGLYYANGILMGIWPSTKYNITKHSCYGLNLPDDILNEFKREGELNDRSNTLEINPDFLSRSKTLQTTIYNLSKEIEDCKKNLLDTDYIVTKFTEGLISAAEWLKSKASRANWRSLINKDEGPLAEAIEQLEALKQQIKGDNPSLKDIYWESVTKANEMLPAFQEWFENWQKPEE